MLHAGSTMRLIAVAALLALAGVALARHGRPDVYKIALSGSQEVSGGDTAGRFANIRKATKQSSQKFPLPLLWS